MNARPQLTPELSVEVAGGVQRVLAGNAGMMTGPGTNSYVLGSGDYAVIDPGPDDDTHLQAIVAAAAGRIRWILATHTHRDHSPLVLRLAQLSGAEVIGLPPPHDGRQDETFAPHRMPGDGERLQLGELQLTAIHTPGHASNCVCYLLESAGMLFTGDHILEGVTPVILPPDGDMAAYFASLDKLMPYAFERIAPGHGEVMERGKHMIKALRAHRSARENKVLRCLKRAGSATLDSLTPLVYDDAPADRHRWARLTLEAHLLKLLREGRVVQQGETWLPHGA